MITKQANPYKGNRIEQKIEDDNNMIIFQKGVTYKSVRALCDSRNFNYENFRFRAKKLNKKPSELTENEIETILSTRSHPGRKEYADFRFKGHSFRSAEEMALSSGTRISLSTIKARLKKLKCGFNDLDDSEKGRLLFDSTYPAYTRQIDAMKNSIETLIVKYQDLIDGSLGNNPGVPADILVKDLQEIIN